MQEVLTVVKEFGQNTRCGGTNVAGWAGRGVVYAWGLLLEAPP